MILDSNFQKHPTGAFYKKKGVFKNFAKITRKYLSRSLFVNKVAGLRLRYVFSSEFCKIVMNIFFAEQLRETAFLNFLWRNVSNKFIETMLTHFGWKLEDFLISPDNNIRSCQLFSLSIHYERPSIKVFINP